MARRRIEHGVDPEDVVQETLLAIHLKRHTWRADGPVLPWVFAIARYKLIDHLRKNKIRASIPIEDADELAFETDVPEPSAARLDVEQNRAGRGRPAEALAGFEGRPADRQDRRPGWDSDQ